MKSNDGVLRQILFETDGEEDGDFYFRKLWACAMTCDLAVAYPKQEFAEQFGVQL